MIDELKDILEQNAREYYKNALNAEKKQEYNSAVTLFFKTIASLSDLFIFIKEGKMPSNHTERFRILGLKYREVYNILDKDFPLYQDTYRMRLNKEVSEVLKEDAKRLFELLNLKI